MFRSRVLDPKAPVFLVFRGTAAVIFLRLLVFIALLVGAVLAILTGLLLFWIATENVLLPKKAGAQATKPPVEWKLARPGVSMRGDTTVVVLPPFADFREIAAQDLLESDPDGHEMAELYAKLACTPAEELGETLAQAKWFASAKQELGRLSECSNSRQIIRRAVFIEPVNGSDTTQWVVRHAANYNVHIGPCIKGGPGTSVDVMVQHARTNPVFQECVMRAWGPVVGRQTLSMLGERQCKLFYDLPDGMFFRADFGTPNVRPGFNRRYVHKAGDPPVPFFACELGNGLWSFIRVQCGNPLVGLQGWELTIYPEPVLAVAPRPQPVPIQAPAVAYTPPPADTAKDVNVCTGSSCNVHNNNPWPIVLVSVAAIWCGYTALSNTPPCGRRERQAGALKPVGGPITRPDVVLPALGQDFTRPFGPPSLLPSSAPRAINNLGERRRGKKIGQQRYVVPLGRIPVCFGILEHVCH